MPLPHSIHLLLNHVSDCMRRARSTAGSSRDARSPLCATGVNDQRACGDHRAVLLDARIDRCCFRSLRAGARTAHMQVCGTLQMLTSAERVAFLSNQSRALPRPCSVPLGLNEGSF